MIRSKASGRVVQVIALSLLAAASATGAAAVSPEIADLARRLGFDESEVARAAAGELVSSEQAGGSNRELALAVAAYVETSPDRVYERLVTGKGIGGDPTVIAFGEIAETAPSANAFAALELPASELNELANAKPGSDFNLSQAEIDQLNAADGNAAVMQAYRVILAERMRAYRKRGLAGIAPYARRGGELRDVAQEFRNSMAQDKKILRDSTGFFDMLERYPESVVPDTQHRFVWVVQNIQGRPTASLRHRIVYRGDDGVVLVSRQFYVGRSYNALQVITGVLRAGQGGMLFYINRTSTDQVDVFAGGMARRIGRGMMLSEIEALFEEYRASL